MATRSAAKAHRQSIKRRIRNRVFKSSTKTAVKRAVETIVSGDLNAAREDIRGAIRALDRAAQKGVLHPNNASRRKSRLLLRYNAAVASLQVTEEKPARKKAEPKSTKKVAPARKATTPKAKK